jgi:hypothetical protein
MLSSIVSLLPDRQFLEKTVFRYLLESHGCQRILFVGCRWYTRRYNALLASKQYSTLDRDPAQRRHGAPRHIIDTLENLPAHVGGGELDVIVCNGVVGWGLDEPEAVRRAFAASCHCLRTGGLFIVGWNDTRRRCVRSTRGNGPFLEACGAASHFDRFHFPGAGGWRHRTPSWNKHVYDFYVKRAGAPPHLG